MKQFFPLFFILLSLENSLSMNVLPIIFRFIYDNEKMCNDPFADPNWLPALEDCQLDCDITSQICQENVLKVYPGQRCINLPANCTMALKSLLNVDAETPAIQIPLAPLTIPPLTNEALQHLRSPGIIEISQFQHFWSRKPPETALPKKIFKDFTNFHPPGIAPSPPTIDPADKFGTNTNSATRIPPEYEDERNVENSKFVSTQTTSTDGYYANIPQPYPRQYPEKKFKKLRNPVSRNMVLKKLKKTPIYSNDEGNMVVDRSLKCCQWALDGLCDRNWRKIRNMCPKSCGRIVCTVIDGAISCNRVIEVDVLDCFQRKHLTAARASPTVKSQNHFTKKLKKKPKPDYETNDQNKNSYAVANAFTIENEIKSFLSLG